MSGKSTALAGLYKKLHGNNPIISIETSHQENKRTLFYDYGSLDLSFGIWKLKLNLWTATGQDFYCETRSTVLQGTDGIIFILDSRESVLQENLKSWNELKSFFGSRLENIIPVVICLNKRDLPHIISPEQLQESFDLDPNTNLFETIATQNQGIYPAFKSLFETIFKIHKTAKTSIMSQLKQYPKT